MDHEGDSETNGKWHTWKHPQRIGKGTGRLRNQRTSRDHPEYSISRSARMLRRVLKICGDLLSLKDQRETISKRRCVNFQIIIIIMHNPAPVLENDTHKLLWDFDIQTDQVISTRRPDLIIINKKKKKICKIVDFAVPADHRIKLKECEKQDKYIDLARELKKLWNMKVTIIPIVIGAFGTVTKGLLKGLDDLEVGGRGETIQTTATEKNTEKSPGDLRRLAVTQSPVKDHQLTLM